ncbi:hypothetical protein BH11PSE11_BH11PSE11_13210 [soil metagenome]
MFATVPEKRMRVVRTGLLFGWLLILLSLFWDPVTIELTRPDNLASPFHIKPRVILLQGVPVEQAPYAMGPRIFWTMLIPLIPLYLMLFGHEAWRRICPLSFVNQIPRFLSWQRRKMRFNRRSGLVERQLNLFKKDGWMARNAWAVQFGLLFVAMNMRILFVNADPLALAIFLICILSAALFAGYFWGGKTWCHYICPVSVVQKIYTQPRGLLESQAHVERKPVTQSMCRASSPAGDRSTCVGCVANCPDIDLENSHWEGIDNPARRFTYYGFFGLVLGFYVYFYLYAGNWDYYFSGFWARETNQLQTLFHPGFFINGKAIGIPKLFAAPLTIGAFILASYVLGIGLEKAYGKLRIALNHPLPHKDLLNHCFAFSAVLSINVFYVFGGRSNLLLLPDMAMRLVDTAIVVISTLWFWRAIARTPDAYRRESLTGSLLNQLKNLKFDFQKVLDGRSLNDLKPDEVYVLAKTLPGFSREQKAEVYRNVLQDALATGKTDSGRSLELLKEVRLEMGVSEDEHRAILDGLGIDNADLLDPERAMSQESWIRTNNYRGFLERLLMRALDEGVPLPEYLAQPETIVRIRESQEIFQISEAEHAAMLAQLTGAKSALVDKGMKLLETIAGIASDRHTLKLHGGAYGIHGTALLARLMAQRSAQYCEKLMNLMSSLGPTAETEAMARNLHVLLGDDWAGSAQAPVASIENACAQLAPQIQAILRGEALPEADSTTQIRTYSYSDVVVRAQELGVLLAALVLDRDPYIRSIALMALAEVNLDRARALARQFAGEDTTTQHWLLTETAQHLSGNVRPRKAFADDTDLHVLLQFLGKSQREMVFNKPLVTIGKAADNDIVVHAQAVAPYHAMLRRSDDLVQVECLDRMHGLVINGIAMHGTSQKLVSGDSVGFHVENGNTPFLTIRWNAQSSRNHVLQQFDSVSKLLWLSEAEIFSHLDLSTLADMARVAEFRIYQKGSVLCQQGEIGEEAFLLHSGAIEAFVEVNGEERLLGKIAQGQMVAELGVITNRPRSASLRVTSEQAGILLIQGRTLNVLMDTDPRVAKAILMTVAAYAQRQF